MWRRNNRSRAVTKQPGIMAADQSPFPPPLQPQPPNPAQNPTRPVYPFFGSPRFFNGFLSKGLLISDPHEAVMSPTSILDTNKSFSNNPFGFDKTLTKPAPKMLQEAPKRVDSEGIGLALLDLEEEHITSRKVLFGSKLKIQIPPSSAFSPSGSPKSPGDFGIKTRNSLSTPTGFGPVNLCIRGPGSGGASRGPLSLSEMELSEEYTCVISRGPNPKTTHIYDNCVVESCWGEFGSPELNMGHNLDSPAQNFLSLCYNCKKHIGEDRDIYMYRGEKAFCSEECRCQEMLLDELMNNNS